MTAINTDEWVTASEASRLLACSPQRVQQMADDDGLLDVLRPWPRVTLVGRVSLDAWLAGERPPRITPIELRRFVLKRTGGEVADLDLPWLQDLAREFIEGARPRWDNLRKDLWALEAAQRLFRTATADTA